MVGLRVDRVGAQGGGQEDAMLLAVAYVRFVWITSNTSTTRISIKSAGIYRTGPRSSLAAGPECVPSTSVRCGSRFNELAI